MTPVGQTEIAERLGVPLGTVKKWKTRGLLPEPDWTVGGRPAWSLDRIEAWAVSTGRLILPAREDFRPSQAPEMVYDPDLVGETIVGSGAPRPGYRQIVR